MIISLGISIIFFAYILGHIISYVSHWASSKILVPDKFFNDQKSVQESCFYSELKRKVFNPEKITEYKKELCRPHLNDVSLKNKDIFLGEESSKNRFTKISESIALSIADPYYSQMIYNTLVISGTFRAMTLVFAAYWFFLAIHCLLLLFCKTEIFIFASKGSIVLLVLVVILTVLSFRIYCKYFRRYHELCDTVLVLKPDSKEEDKQ